MRNWSTVSKAFRSLKQQKVLTLLYWPKTYFSISGGAVDRSGSSADTWRQFWRHNLRAPWHLDFKSTDDSVRSYNSTSLEKNGLYLYFENTEGKISYLGKTLALATACVCSGLCLPNWPMAQAVHVNMLSSEDSLKICASICTDLQPSTVMANWSDWPLT